MRMLGVKRIGRMNKDNWFLLGDIHGGAGPLYVFYKREKDRLNLDKRKNYMILLGDVGLNFQIGSMRDQKVKEELSALPFTYICLRGNHESRVRPLWQANPESWNKEVKYDGLVYVEKEFPNIHYLSDVPEVYSFAGFKTLSIPGAYSVDKDIRLLRGWPWFSDEQLTDAEKETGRSIAKDKGPFELVISHTCPGIYTPTDLFIAGIDQSKVDRTMEQYLNEIEFDLDYKRWAFGHYHADRLYPSCDAKRMLMLYNANVVDLRKFMNMKSTDILKDIFA